VPRPDKELYEYVLSPQDPVGTVETEGGPNVEVAMRKLVASVDVHGTGTTCHAVLAASAARVSGSALSEHQYCPNWADCIYGNA